MTDVLLLNRELLEILSYNELLTDTIVHPSVRLKVWKKVTFQTFGFMTGPLYWWLYIVVLFSQRCCRLVQRYYRVVFFSQSLIQPCPKNEQLICSNKWYHCSIKPTRWDVVGFGNVAVLCDM